MTLRFALTGLFLLSALLGACEKPTPLNTAEKTTKEGKSGIDLAELIKRAEQGNAQAQLQLGNKYLAGEGIPKDVAKASEWYQKAADQGLSEAQTRLGRFYENGESTSKNVVRAAELYQKAAEQGNAEAQIYLGGMYERGEGVSKNIAKAIELYQKAVDQGNPEAQFILGIKYEGWMDPGESSTGVIQDVGKAVELYRRAAVQGHAGAQYALGTSYRVGSGVPKDYAKAVEWYLKSAASGNEIAQQGLGEMYFAGKGIPQDYVLAYAWINLGTSGSNRFVDPDANRDLIARSMTPSQIAEAQRISSAWKKGAVLVREGQVSAGSQAFSSSVGKLSKASVGTLFVINASGQAITNHHVISGCGEIRIEGREGLARIVTEDVVNDLALVQIPGGAKDFAFIADEPRKLRQGEEIVVFGFPLNAVLSSGGNLTPGVVSALTGLGNNTNQIQITAPIQPGSSGSPVLNKKGEVVGVVSTKLSDSKMAKATGQIGQNVNFAVNGQTLRTFLDTHKSTYRSGAGFFAREKSAADLADEARNWTLVVECWK